MKKSTIILIIGLVIVAVGAALSVAKIEPYADYVLVAGALVVIIRGFICIDAEQAEEKTVVGFLIKLFQ